MYFYIILFILNKILIIEKLDLIVIINNNKKLVFFYFKIKWSDLKSSKKKVFRFYKYFSTDYFLSKEIFESQWLI